MQLAARWGNTSKCVWCCEPPTKSLSELQTQLASTNALVHTFPLSCVVPLSVLNTLQATRQKIETAAAINAAPPPAQGRLEFIADRVKQRRYNRAAYPFNMHVCAVCASKQYSVNMSLLMLAT